MATTDGFAAGQAAGAGGDDPARKKSVYDDWQSQQSQWSALASGNDPAAAKPAPAPAAGQSAAGGVGVQSSPAPSPASPQGGGYGYGGSPSATGNYGYSNPAAAAPPPPPASAPDPGWHDRSEHTDIRGDYHPEIQGHGGWNMWNQWVPQSPDSEQSYVTNPAASANWNGSFAVNNVDSEPENAQSLGAINQAMATYGLPSVSSFADARSQYPNYRNTIQAQNPFDTRATGLAPGSAASWLAGMNPIAAALR